MAGGGKNSFTFHRLTNFEGEVLGEATHDHHGHHEDDHHGHDDCHDYHEYAIIFILQLKTC